MTAWAQWFLSHALCGTRDLVEGEALTKASLDGFRALGERWGEAAAPADRSVQRLLRGDLAGTEKDAGRSAELFREVGEVGEVGDACGQLWSVYPLSSVAEIHGDYARAARLRQDGLDTAEEFGLSTQAADLLSGLGRTALLTGDLGRAREYHERSRRLAAELGFRAGEINAELGLGLGARREGLFDEAAARMRTVLEWHRQVGLDGANALILAELGFIAELRGDAQGAPAHHEEGYATALATGDPRAVALALEGLAAAHALAGRPGIAALLLGAASAARAATGAPLPAAERPDVNPHHRRGDGRAGRGGIRGLLHEGRVAVAGGGTGAGVADSSRGGGTAHYRLTHRAERLVPLRGRSAIVERWCGCQTLTRCAGRLLS
ncbi:hypothetical protein AB0D04_06200 [Streptomyces sp. NPDC048483]|uniref:hypothetical protein n=1 Tax=Streptomyces sp. NPDC048483 TaxID=3154927 RepID=UPI00343B3D69